MNLMTAIKSLIYVLLLCLQTLPAAATDLWPLVKSAEGAVWGRLAAVKEGVSDRLLTVVFDEQAGGRVSGGPDPILQLLDRSGRLPEGTPLMPGGTGLFLYHSPRAGSADFVQVDAELVAGGFLPGMASAQDRALIEILLAESEGASPTASALVGLLDSANPVFRGTFLHWLVEHPDLDLSGVSDRLSVSFAAERDGETQCQYLNLFLVRGLPLAVDGIASLVLTTRDPVLLDLCHHYLSRHGSDRDVAILLAAYPRADTATRLSLLDAYSHLQLAEASPWWQLALASDHPSEVQCAIEGLCVSGLPDVEETYGLLLSSRSDTVQQLSLRGLASLATPRAAELLRQYAEDPNTDPKLRTLAHRILERPYRYGRVRIKQP